MDPGKYNLKIYQGDTFSLEMRIKNDDGTDIDLTGVHARMQIRKFAHAVDSLISLDSAGAGGITIDGSAVKVQIPAAVTAAFAAQSAVYDLELINPDLTVKTLIAGQVSITKEVTR
jgi:hypothetical protein